MYKIYAKQTHVGKYAVQLEKQQFMFSTCPTSNATIKCQDFHKQWFSLVTIKISLFAILCADCKMEKIKLP